METDRLTIFLSGTRKDLRPFFLEAQKAIEEHLPTYQVVTMDELTSEDITSERWSRRAAATRDVLVGLVGRYFGTVRDDGPSLTEQEYDAAERAGVHRLMFLTDAGEPAIIESQDDSARHRLEKFRERIEASVVCRKVSTPEEFAHGVVRAIRDWEHRTLHGLLMSTKQFVESCETTTTDGLMSHEHSYVGAGGPGRCVEEFLASPQRVLVLHGAWGRGKTRALLELCQRERPLDLRFLRPYMPISQQQLKELVGEHYALVVEDVHDGNRHPAGALRALLFFLKQRAPGMKLIVTVRTNRLQAFNEQLREQRFERSELLEYELPALSDKEQRQLIQTILGREEPELAYRLARRTRGNALATVLVARRARMGAESLHELEGSDFEYSIVGSFFDLLIQQAGQNQERRQQLEEMMRLLAVVGPFRPGDSKQMEALARFLGTRSEHLSDALEALEAAGLISRYGGLVRVPVDAVSEHLVVRAAVNSRGESKHYIERVMDELAEPFLANILRNLAAADGYMEGSGRVSNVTQGVWNRLPGLYRRLRHPAKERMLEAVGDIAPLYPLATLRFAEWLRGSGPSLLEGEEPYRDMIGSSVRFHVTQLLGTVLDAQSCVMRACDLLWEWAASQSPDSNAKPDTAERILSEAGAYRLTKSVPAYEAFVDWADSRTRGERKIPTPRLARYLRPLLRHELEHHWSDGDSMTMLAMGLPYAPVEALRRRVIGLLTRLASEGEIQDIHQALEALGEALSPRLGMFNREVPDDKRAGWVPEQAYVLECLRHLRAEQLGNVVGLCIREQIHGLAKCASEPSLHATAKELLDEIQHSLTGTLEQALVAKMRSRETVQEATRRLGGLDREAAQKLVESHGSPDESLKEVTQLIVALEQAGMRPRISGLFRETAQVSPEHGRVWSRTLLGQPGHPLRPYAHDLARGLLQSAPPAGKELFERLLEDGSPDLLRELRLWGLEGTVFDGRALTGHLNRLVRHQAAHVREAGFHQLRLLDEVAPGERTRLLLEYPLAEFRDSAEDWAAAIAHDDGPYALYGQAERERLALQLRVPRSLGFWCWTLLELLAGDVPASVVDTVLARTRASSVDSMELEPHRRKDKEESLLARLPAAERQRALEALGELFEQKRSSGYMARLWFVLLCRGDVDSARTVRRRWIESGTSAGVRRALNSFGAAEPEALFEHEAEVIALLRAARRLGPEEFDRVKNSLSSLASHGTRVGSPGQPYPRDVAIRDRARGLADKYSPDTMEGGFYREVADAMDRTMEHRMAKYAEEHL